MSEPLSVREAPASYLVELETRRVRPNYKQTEVGMIPGDWNLKRVGDIATTVASGRSRVDSEFGDYPVYGSTGIIGRCTHGDYFGRAILIARVGANAGKLSVVDGEYGVTDNTIMLKIDSSFHMDYFWRQLEAKRLNSMVFGSGQPLITGTQIKNLAIPFPPTKTEQEAIAEALSDADALIESLEQLIAKKRHLKQGAMQELLTGKKRLPGFSGEWSLMLLMDFVKAEKFAIVDGPFGTQMKVEEYVPEGVPVIEMEHLNDSIINQRLARCITPKKFEQLRRSAVYPGDIVISKTGSLGYLGVIPESVERGIVTSRLAKISLNPSRANVSFIFQYLLKLRNDGYWETVSQGGTMQILGIRMLQNAPIPNISVLEQTAIATILSDMDTEIAALETRLAKTRELKQGMMHNLLTGRIRLV